MADYLLPPSLKHLNGTKIYLGSASPRRAQLLRDLDIPFEVLTSSLPELVPDDVRTKQYASFLSQLKNRNIRTEINSNDLLITADTVVIKNNRILNKPNTLKEAKEMLVSLSNSNHEVHTAISVSKDQSITSVTDIAHVTFSNMSLDEIDHYIKKYKPLDKAGAYGIQEWIGMACIKEIRGSFYTIMGLPTYHLYQILKKEF